MKENEMSFCGSPYFTMIQIMRQVYNIGKNMLETNLSGISFEEFILLDIIKSFPGKSQQDLCEMLLLDKSRMSKMLNVLEEQKYIKRHAGIDGRRLKKFIFISDKGMNILAINKDIMKLFTEKYKQSVCNDDNLNDELKKRLKYVSEVLDGYMASRKKK